MAVGRAIYNWCQAGEGGVRLPPAASLVTPEVLAGYLPGGVPWPTNPFTGAPMRLGNGPGEIRYTTGHEGGQPCFTLESRGTWGQDVPGAVWLLHYPSDKAGTTDGPTPAVS